MSQRNWRQSFLLAYMYIIFTYIYIYIHSVNWYNACIMRRWAFYAPYSMMLYCRLACDCARYSAKMSLLQASPSCRLDVLRALPEEHSEVDSKNLLRVFTRLICGHAFLVDEFDIVSTNMLVYFEMRTLSQFYLKFIRLWKWRMKCRIYSQFNTFCFGESFGLTPFVNIFSKSLPLIVTWSLRWS